MTVRIMGNSWRVDIRHNHTRYRIKCPENSKAGAQAYEALLRQKLARGEPIHQLAETSLPFKQFAARWFEEYVIPNNKTSEQRTKRYILSASLIPFFGKTSIEGITSYQIEQYKAYEMKKGVTNKTLKNRLTVLNKCLATAYEWLNLEGKPPKIKWPKCSSYRTDYLSPEECELLLQSSDGVCREMILTALRTGMRQGELRGLQWSAVNWQNQSLAIRHSRCDYQRQLVPTKNNRERHVPLDVDVYEMLYNRKKSTGYVFLDTDGQPFHNKRLARRLEKVCRKAGMRRITWHILRHTFASHLATRGVPLPAVKELLGHANIGTTMRYSHLAPSTLRSAIEMLNPKTMKNMNFGHQVGTEWLWLQKKETAEKSAMPKNA